MSQDRFLEVDVGVGYSTDPDSRRAGSEAASKAVKVSGDPAVAFLFTTDSYDQRAVWESVKGVIGDSKLVGVCAGGIIVGDSVLRRGVCILTLSGDGLRVATSLQRGLSEDPRGAGRRVGEELLSGGLRRGTVFVFPDGFAADISKALRGLYDAMGPDFTYVGGGAGDNLNFFRTYQFNEKGVQSDALAAAVLQGVSMSTAIACGWKPRGEPPIITRAQGKTVFEIDDRPAFEVYSELLGGIPPRQFAEYGMRHPIGFPDIWGNYVIRDPWKLNPDGSIEFVTEVPEGAVGYVMTYSQDLVVQSAARAVRKAVEGIQPRFVLVFDCISRYLLLGAAFADEMRAIRDVVGSKVPLLGMLTFGEIGHHGDVPFFHNKTLVLAIAATAATGQRRANIGDGRDHDEVVTGELSALYEISRMSRDKPNRALEEVLSDLMGRTPRLFGVRRYALFLGPRDSRRLIASLGFRDEAEALKQIERTAEEGFRFDLGEGGRLGMLYMEKGGPLERREGRLHEMFARQLEEILLRKLQEQERQRVFEELKESEFRFRALVEQSLVGVYLIDSDRFLYANEALARMSGYSQKELMDLRPIDLIHPADRSKAAELIDRSLKGEVQFIRFSFRAVTRQGRTVHCETFARALEIGQRRLIIGTAVDRTEQKRLEEQVRRGQKMEALGRLAAGIAHDFGNALTAIRGNIELALLKLHEQSPLWQNLHSAHKVCDLAAETVRKLLFFGQQQPIVKSSVDVNGLVQETLHVLDRLLGEDISVFTELDPRLGPVEGDPAALSQVLINLLLNARDAMPRGGTIRIATTAVKLRDEDVLQHDPEARPGEFVCLSVQDTGEGMQQDVLEKIFEPFFTTKRGAGSGMGLAVAYGIAKEHGGWISVESKPAEGSTFRVYLPISGQVRRKHVPQEAVTDQLDTQGETILVVEDDEEIKRMVEMALVEAGYRVLSAAGVREAIARFEAVDGRVDLLLADVVLPDGDGVELIEWLLRRKPTLRVLITSGYTGQRSRAEKIRGRSFAFLQKPYSLTKLLGAVRSALKGDRR